MPWFRNSSNDDDNRPNSNASSEEIAEWLKESRAAEERQREAIDEFKNAAIGWNDETQRLTDEWKSLPRWGRPPLSQYLHDNRSEEGKQNIRIIDEFNNAYEENKNKDTVERRGGRWIVNGQSMSDGEYEDWLDSH